MSFDHYVNIDKNITKEAMTILETDDGIQQEMDEEDNYDDDKKESTQTPMCFNDVASVLEQLNSL